jgi:hypothetical protein
MKRLIKNIKKCLSDDLLTSKYRKMKTVKDDLTFGHCYIATEAAYHLYGKSRNYKPHVMRYNKNITHWFLKDDKGNIIDVTLDQYLGEIPKYQKAKGCGFLTNKPSKRAQIIIDRYNENKN